jgi:glutamate racemase
MTYKAPPDLVAKHQTPEVIPLIEANARRFEADLRAGYDRVQAKANSGSASILTFDAWAFELLDEVFNDMLEARVDHTSAKAYTEEVGRRLGMKIKKSIKNAGEK